MADVGFMVMDDALWDELLSGDVCSVDVYEKQSSVDAIVCGREHAAGVDFNWVPQWQMMVPGVRFVSARVVLDSDGSLRAVPELVS